MDVFNNEQHLQSNLVTIATICQILLKFIYMFSLIIKNQRILLYFVFNQINYFLLIKFKLIFNLVFNNFRFYIKLRLYSNTTLLSIGIEDNDWVIPIANHQGTTRHTKAIHCTCLFNTLTTIFVMFCHCYACHVIIIII